ncbi:nuclear transport factor 2 family protein [Brevundimonas pishanensis]|uniref:nuclear transport factor 2 family protein n=1 Tax=Brevundimonas pishanensis TaxID=2896315 RepID=UPI001FA76D5A|nr:nuclear transport factor 2 family protein [Brevundimonas pishanensis]
MANIERLLSMIDAWARQDLDAVMTFLHDDIEWNNSGGFGPVIKGKAAMREALDAMAANIAESRWRLFDYVEEGDRLWMEGADEFILKDGKRIAIPYMGMLEYEGGLIRYWREYYNGYLHTTQGKTGEVAPEAQVMLDRPAITGPKA